MGKFLAKVGRDPKTCATQIASFCRGGARTASTTTVPAGGEDYPGHGNKSRDQRGRRGARRQDVAAGEEGAEEEESTSAATTREGKKNRVAFAAADGLSPAPSPSTASLAEILAAFGFVFEGAGAAVKPSVAEAFAMLRLHAQPAEARAAGEAAKRYLLGE